MNCSQICPRGRSMNRKQLIDYIGREYGVAPDYPFSKDFDSQVFRHQKNLMKLLRFRITILNRWKMMIISQMNCSNY